MSGAPPPEHAGTPYAEGVALFQREEWFEAHEVLEAAWRPCPRGPRREFLQGLIQLAVSLEHWRRGNPRGAWGQWTKARQRLAPLPREFDAVALGELLDTFARYWEAVGLEAAVAAQARGEAFTRPDLPRPAPRWLYGE